jgi:small multidrug resistance family-3 protein
MSTTIPWTVQSAIQAASLFVGAGLCEIGGGWLVWQSVRSKRPWWWAVFGVILLAAYGFVPTLQPPAAGNEFGRLDAAYGGIFIGMSFLWGRVLDGMRLDLGDLIGSMLCLAGVVVIMAWPRGSVAPACCNGTNVSDADSLGPGLHLRQLSVWLGTSGSNGAAEGLEPMQVDREAGPRD